MFGVLAAMGSDLIERKEMSEEQNKAPNEGEARVLSDDELKGIVGGGFAPAEVVSFGSLSSVDLSEILKRAESPAEGSGANCTPIVQF